MGACLILKEATVSVMMPIGRVDEFVAPAIRSVLQQRDVEVELIVVGPAELTNQSPQQSSQRSPGRQTPQQSQSPYSELSKLLNEQFANDSRIRLVQREKPGVVSAANTALQHARCDYLARMDADDTAEPERLCQQLKLSKQYDDECLVGACVSIFSDTHPILPGNQHYEHWLNQHTKPDDIRTACFVESPMPNPTLFAHKTIWKRIGIYQDGDFPEDYDLLLRAWLLGIPMVKPDALLLNWREHELRLTRTDRRYRREAFINLKAKTLADPRSGLAVHDGRKIWIAGTGRNARYWHDALELNNANVAGFVDLDGPKAKQQKRHKPVISYKQLALNRGNDLLVTAITAPAARNKLRNWFDEQGMCLGVDVVLGG